MARGSPPELSEGTDLWVLPGRDLTWEMWMLALWGVGEFQANFTGWDFYFRVEMQVGGGGHWVLGDGSLQTR